MRHRVPSGPDWRGELHVVGTGALLAALGGFAEEAPVHSRGSGVFTPADLRLMESFYRRFSGPSGRLERGRAAELAQWLGRRRVALSVAMHKMRERGVLPPLRRGA